MQPPNGATFASSSPLFVPNFCLYSNSENKEFIKSAFSLQKGLFSLELVPYDILGLLRFLAENTMRVGELLSIQPKDCITGCRFMVRGLKRSRNYAVVLPGLWLEKPPKRDARWSVPVVDMKYHYIYKWCCRIGITGGMPGRKNCARTHAHRYLTARAVNDNIGSIAAGDILHHNSRKAVSFYIKEKVVSHGKD